MMGGAHVLAAVRTPRGKGRPGGALSGIPALGLLEPLYRAMVERGVDPAQVDDLILGCVTATGEQGANLARISALYAGWPDSVPGATVNRFCASGLEACAMAAGSVAAGGDALVIAGGVESVSRVPMYSDGGAWFSDPAVRERTAYVHMGLSADLLAEREVISREELDECAFESHRRAARARDEGRFGRTIVPITDSVRGVTLTHDEPIRDDCRRERLAALEPAFGTTGGDALALARYPELSAIARRHTLATSPAVADGAALVAIGQDGASGLPSRARIRAVARAAVEPVLMLHGNVQATEKVLKRAGMIATDIDLFEVNESFAAVPIAYRRHFAIDPERLNVNGGAIALGHPLGATGAILLATALDELERRGLATALISICGGAGVATALILERPG